MIRALVWKEAREQGLIVSALAVLGGGVLVAAGLLNPTTSDLFSRQFLTDPGFLSLLMLTVTAGVVVGGTLFAGEKEAGTFPFLTLLPVPRWKVWAGKMCGGAVLVLAVAAVLFAVAAGVGIVGPVRTLPAAGLVMLVVALAAFAWGSVGSNLARSSLSAAGVGGLIGVFTTAALLPLGWVVMSAVTRGRFGRDGTLSPTDASNVLGLAVLFAMFAFPFLLSLWMFTAPDRDRKLRTILGPAGGKNRRRIPLNPFGWLSWLKRPFPTGRAAVWLVWKQTRVSALVLGLLGLCCGGLMLIPGTPVLVVWPGVTLFLAVLVGAIGWADEQGSGAGRFWVERRIPVGRLWGAKVAVGLGITLLVSFLVALPTVLLWGLVRMPYDERGSMLVHSQDFPLFSFLLLWPVYGFAFGHLVGLLFRKAIVAVAVATMTGAVAAAVWLPSLLGGGVHFWQLWAVPLLVLLTARVLAWRSAADLVGSLPAFARLAVGGAAVLAAVGLGLGYRVAEIPDPPERNDDFAFRSEIPPFASNDSGREVRRAAVTLVTNRGDAALLNAVSEIPSMPRPHQYWGIDTPTQVFGKPRQQQLETVMEHGWQPDDPTQFRAWLAKMTAGDWPAVLAEATRLPLGTVEDPTELEINSPLRHLYSLQGADTLLLVDALRRQADGDPTAFVTAYDTVLRVSRIVRHKSVLACAVFGRQMERRAHQALVRWLEKLSGREHLIREVERVLADHARWATDDAADVRLAEQVVLRNSVKAPTAVLREGWHYNRPNRGEEAKRVMDTEADLVAVAWQMPWEKERHARLVGLGNRRPAPSEWDTWPDVASDWVADNVWGAVFGVDKFRAEMRQVKRSPYWGMPGIGWGAESRSVVLDRAHAAVESRVAADRNAATIMLAVRRYELKYGVPPASLDQLVPDYLPAVPRDPDGKPMRYRVSDGEVMTTETQTEPPGLTLPPEVLAGVQAAGGLVPPEVMYLRGAATYNSFRGQLFLPPGRAVLWSVGPNRADRGGREYNTTRQSAGEWVYLVPPAPPSPEKSR